MIEENRIRLFVELGKILKNLGHHELEEISVKAASYNNWFTPENVKAAIQGVAKYLDEVKLRKWTGHYNTPSVGTPQKIGLVMAGNIPLAGFHDMLCILISGHTLKAKLSSQDPQLPKFVAEILCDLEPEMKNKIFFDDKLQDFDAVIATGSDNSSRFFDYYFSRYPHIIRKNRNSVAVLFGNETQEDFIKLGKDIFQYFGLGCRNISKIYVPKNYNFNDFFKAIEAYNYVSDHHKYNNNYDYNKSIYLVNGVKHLDNGFLLLTENKGLVSPISVTYFDFYEDLDSLPIELNGLEGQIQCIVSKNAQIKGSVPLGTAQNPEVWDYADNVDTMKFLSSL